MESVVSKFAVDSTQHIWLQNICFDEYANISMENDDVHRESSEWETFKKYLLKISQPCTQMLMLCRFALETYKCMELFDTVLSDEGDLHSINMLEGDIFN